jgi:nucleotide-binding universal stress UspA family protein
VFQRILVPVDFTPRSQRAARTAGRIASGSHAETTLLHVIERIDADTGGPLRSFYARLERSARRKMAALLEELGRRGLAACGEVLYGNRVNEILRFAGEKRIDLIVMSSHKLPVRRGPENWGTISYKVGILARCPVLLVK